MSPSISLQIFVGLPIIALLFRLLELSRPLARQRLLRRGWKGDVAFYVLGCFLGQFSSALCLAAMLFLRHITGMDFGRLASLQSSWLQVLEIVLISDLLGYLFHRLLHDNAWLWRFHKVHHTSHHMDWLSAARLHPVDRVLGDFIQLVPLLCLGFGDGPLLVYASILGFQMFLNHSNVRLSLGRLRWVVAGPDFHQWHHCEDPSAYNKNFAPHLVIFDRLFGTAHIPEERVKPWKYGVRESVPEGFWRQLIHPFQQTVPVAKKPRKRGILGVPRWLSRTKVQLSLIKVSFEISTACVFAVLMRRCPIL
jgi:sterol desaturase/sphingolipid hydroxylase (fatty acid hydroxylase superfamily)